MSEKEIVLYSIIAGIFILAMIVILLLKRNFNNYLKQSSEIVQLTGLYTYEGFVKRLKGKEDKLISILSMCVKGNSELQNSLGTQGYDVVLVNIAKVLLSKLDRKLRLAAHFSYDTFSIAIASSDAGKVMCLIDEIALALEKYNNDAYSIEMYYGYDIGYQNVITLERSLLALKYAMRRKQTVLQYGDDIVSIQSTFDNLLNDPEIIKEQFKVYYQPKVNATTGEIVGAEALSRWVDIDGNIAMNPAQYISEFESNGLIVKLDLFVLEEACKLLESMHKRNQKLITISLNFSRIDFEYENLVTDVQDIISKYIFNREYIHIEITESAYIKNEGLMVTKMQQLRELGFAIEMDDFGSGYSSMGTLMNSKFDVVKIDRIFVENNLKLQSEQVFLEGLVKMFRGVDMDVTVEGVESAYVVRQIRRMAPNVIIQGFYFFKPLPLSKFERVLMDDRFVLDDIFKEEVDFNVNQNVQYIYLKEDNHVEEIELIKLEAPEVTISEDGIASWNKIDGASSYIYKLNNRKEISTYALSVKLNPGDSIVVKAVGDSSKYENSDYSLLDSYIVEEEVYEAIQLPQLNVVIDEDGIASWTPITGALRYVYKINNKKEISTSFTSVKLNEGDSIVVKAIGDGEYYLSGEYSLLDTFVSKTKIVEEPIKPIQLPQLNVNIDEDGIASWTPVTGSASYVYKINNKKEISTSFTSVKLNDGDSIVVKAIGDGKTYLTGEYSLLDTYVSNNVVAEPVVITQTVRTIQLPQLNVNIDEDGIASWTPVTGATAYVYKINNKKEISTTYTSVKLKSGDSIVVKAIGDGDTYLTGEYSLLDTYVSKVEAAPAPVFKAIQLSTPLVTVPDDGMANWSSIPHAASYIYKINDGDETSTSALRVQLNIGDFIVVKAIGDGKNYLDSDFSDEISYDTDYEEFDLSEYDDGYTDETTEEELAEGSNDESDEDEEARVLRLIELYKKQYRDEWEAEMLKKYPDLMKKHYERKQFLEKLVNLDNQQSDNYNKLKNEIMKFNGLKNRTTKYFDTFIHKTTIIVKLGIVGKSIRLYLALDPNEYPEGQFRQKDISDIKRHAKTPLLLKIKSSLSVKRALTLINDLGVKFKLDAKKDYTEKNYVKGMKLQHYKNKQ